jgi:hypothetical protein
MKDFYINKLNYHDRYLLNIPDDIDPKFDKKLWGVIYNLNVVYLDLVQEFVMTDDEIYIVIENWVDLFNNLRSNAEAEKVMLLSIYLYTQFERILEWCLRKEYFEGAANLKRFNELV